MKIKNLEGFIGREVVVVVKSCNFEGQKEFQGKLLAIDLFSNFKIFSITGEIHFNGEFDGLYQVTDFTTGVIVYRNEAVLTAYEGKPVSSPVERKKILEQGVFFP